MRRPTCPGPDVLGVGDSHIQQVSTVWGVGVPGRHTHHPPRHAHPVQHGHVDDRGPAAMVEGLRAVGPEVLALGGVDVGRGEGNLDRVPDEIGKNNLTYEKILLSIFARDVWLNIIKRRSKKYLTMISVSDPNGFGFFADPDPSFLA